MTALTFLDLPGEIRTLIYHHVFSQATITLTNRKDDAQRGPYVWLSSAFALPLLRTCRALYAEAGPILKSQATLVCRDSARPHQLTVPLPQDVIRGIREIVIMHDPHSPLIKDSPLNLRAFSALRTLRVDVLVTSYTHGFSSLPKTTADEQLLALFRDHVGKLKERCDWLGDELRKEGPHQRGFRVEMAIDLRGCRDWYRYWMVGSGIRMAWVSPTVFLPHSARQNVNRVFNVVLGCFGWEC